MDLSNENTLMIFATLVYGLALLYSIFLWRKGFTKDDKVILGMICLGFSFHSAALVIRAAEVQRCPINNLFEVTMFTSWIIGLGFLLSAIWTKSRSHGPFISPVIFSLSLMTLFPNVDDRSDSLTLEGWFILHVPLILLSYGVFALAGVASVMYLTHVHYLKYNKESVFWVRLPSITQLERAATILLYGGVVFLAIGLALGFSFLKVSTGSFISQDAKIFWSIGVLAGYLILVFLHYFRGVRGRYLSWSIIGLLIFVFSTFWAANLLSDIHNNPLQG